MKIKLLIMLVSLLVIGVFGQSTRPRTTSDQMPYGTPVIILNEQSAEAVMQGSAQLAIRTCLAHKKHPIIRYSFENDAGELETYEMCGRDYLRAQLQAMRDAGVRVDKVESQ